MAYSEDIMNTRDDTSPPIREEILLTALTYTTADRNSTHGEPEENFSNIAELWSVYTGNYVSSEDVAAMMCLFKVARIMANPQHKDNWVDMAGYAACGGEVALKEDK